MLCTFIHPSEKHQRPREVWAGPCVLSCWCRTVSQRGFRGDSARKIQLWECVVLVAMGERKKGLWLEIFSGITIMMPLPFLLSSCHRFHRQTQPRASKSESCALVKSFNPRVSALQMVLTRRPLLVVSADQVREKTVSAALFRKIHPNVTARNTRLGQQEIMQHVQHNITT